MAHVEVIMDRSGSMQSRVAETISGFNAFVKAQPKGTTFSLTQFDFGTSVELERTFTRTSKGRAKLNEWNYRPRGLTPLLDAVGNGIGWLRGEIAKDKALGEGKIVFLIVTDGLENASRDFTREQVKTLIAQAKEDGWQVVFMGADIDAFAEAGGLGISRDQTMAYAGDQTTMAYSSVAVATRSYLDGSTTSVTLDGDD